MATRRIYSVAVWTVALVLLGSTAFASEAWSASDLDRPRYDRRQRELVRDLLGQDRWRGLNAARFDFDLYDLAFTPDLSDLPGPQAAVEKMFLRSLVRITEESVERRLLLEERYDSFRARLQGREAHEPGLGARDSSGMRLSPLLDIDQHSTFGAKLRFSGQRTRFWAGAAIRVRHEIASNDLSLKLSFDDPGTRAFFVYHTDKEERGRHLEFKIGFWF